mgnify:FL=1
MLKKIIIIFLSVNLLLNNITMAEDASLTEFVIFWAVAISGTAVTVIYAPVVIPVVIANAKASAIITSSLVAATGTAIKTGSVIVYTKTVAAGTAIKTGCAAAAPVVKVLSPVVLVADYAIQIAEKMPEMNLYMATTEEMQQLFQAKQDFEKCMTKHVRENHVIVPESCKKEALLFALLAEANMQRS